MLRQRQSTTLECVFFVVVVVMNSVGTHLHRAVPVSPTFRISSPLLINLWRSGSNSLSLLRLQTGALLIPSVSAYSFSAASRRRQHCPKFIGRQHAPQSRRLFTTQTTNRHASLHAERAELTECDDNTTVVALHDLLLDGLNDAQCAAVTQPRQAMTRVVAGPGSGKTKVLTSRVAYLLLGYNERVLAVTFTRKAAGEMQRRLATIVGDNDNAVLRQATLGTFHSVCAKILRWHGEMLAGLPSVRSIAPEHNALNANFGIAEGGEQLRVLKECLDIHNITRWKEQDIRPNNILSAVSRYKEQLATGVDINGDSGNNKKKKTVSLAMEIALKVCSTYRHMLWSNNLLDFDDLILLTRELLEEHADIRASLRRRWPHVLVDEFQDTSRTQMDLIKLLTSRSLLVVGDADQAIYSWRGAHVGSLHDFADAFYEYARAAGQDQVETIYLMENYRSTSDIVQAAQKVISSGEGSHQNSADKLRKDMKPKRDAGPTPKIIGCADDKAEADLVASTVKDFLAIGKITAESSVAVLYRTNAQSRALEEACVKHNLPYVVIGPASFYKRKEIQDCLCYLRWLVNGRDRTAMERAMKTPSRGIGKNAIHEFDDYCEAVVAISGGDSPYMTPLDIMVALADIGNNRITSCVDPTVCISKRSLKALQAFAMQMVQLRAEAAAQPVERVLHWLVTHLELEPHFDKMSKSTAEFEERKANVRELQSAADRYGGNGSQPCLPYVQEGDKVPEESPLSTFLDDIALVAELSEDDASGISEGNRLVINLMTIHASKGMEFDACFVVGNEEGVFPSSQAITANDDGSPLALDEEKRLCYVAMTRAKTELMLTWRREAPVITSRGIVYKTRQRSRFLEALAPAKTLKDEIMGERRPATMAATEFNRSNGDVLDRRRPEMPNLRTKGQVTDRLAKRPYSNGREWRPPSSIALPLSREQKSSTSGTNSIFHKRKGRLAGPTRPNGVRVDTVSKEATPPEADGVTPSTRQKSATRLASSPTTQGGRSQPVPRQVDSSWFYPVGAAVVHRQFGRGRVLPSNDPLQVRVQFQRQENCLSIHDAALQRVWTN